MVPSIIQEIVFSKKFTSDKERFSAVMARQLHYPFSCSDESSKIDFAIAEISSRGEGVYLNDNSNGKVRVFHLEHAFNGGIKINEWGESNIPGLFAAGEAAAGPHGADRIGGCMMTSTQVFGRRAGIGAAKHAIKRRSSAFHDFVVKPFNVK